MMGCACALRICQGAHSFFACLILQEKSKIPDPSSAYWRTRYVRRRDKCVLKVAKRSCRCTAGLCELAYPTWRSIFQPSSLSAWQASMDSMAAVATSAALPWMGVLMAARRACACCKRQSTFISQIHAMTG